MKYSDRMHFEGLEEDPEAVASSVIARPITLPPNIFNTSEPLSSSNDSLKNDKLIDNASSNRDKTLRSVFLGLIVVFLMRFVVLIVLT